MEGAFGAVASGGDAVEGFVFREQRVHAFGGCEFGFEAVGSLYVPGGEDELREECAFDSGAGAKFVFVGADEGLEFLMVGFGEQYGLFGVEAEFCGVGGGPGFAFGRAGAGAQLGVSLIGFDLRDG